MKDPLNLFEDALLCYCRAKGFQDHQWLALLVYAEFILRQEAGHTCPSCQTSTQPTPPGAMDCQVFS